MKLRMPSILIGSVGVALIAIALAARLFTVAPAFERMTDDFRPVMNNAELSQLRQDVNGLSAVQAEFNNEAVPQLAAALGIAPQQFAALMGQQFPAVAAGLAAVPQVTQEFNGVLTVLEDERGRFDRADGIPTGSLPATTVPWGLVGAGALCIAVAFFVPRRRGAVSAVVLGLLLVVVPMVLSLPGKADAADTMNDHLKPVYTAELVAGAKQSLAGMQAMGAEMQTKLLPALAEMLKMPPADVQSYLAANFPAVTASLASMPAAFERFDTLVATFDGSLGNYDEIKSTSLVPIVWALMVGGLLVAGLGGLALAQGAAGAPAARKERIPLRQRLTPAHGHGH